MFGRFMVMYGCSKELFFRLDRFFGSGFGRFKVLYAEDGSDSDDIFVCDGEEGGKFIEIIEFVMSIVRFFIIDLCMFFCVIFFDMDFCNSFSF